MTDTIEYRARGGMYDRQQPGWDEETKTYAASATGKDVSPSGVFVVESRNKIHRVRHVATGLSVPLQTFGADSVTVQWARTDRGATTLPSVTAARAYMKALDAAEILTAENGSDKTALLALQAWMRENPIR